MRSNPKLWWQRDCWKLELWYYVIIMWCFDDDTIVERNNENYWIIDLRGYLAYSYVHESDYYIVMQYVCLMSHWWWKAVGK